MAEPQPCKQKTAHADGTDQEVSCTMPTTGGIAASNEQRRTCQKAPQTPAVPFYICFVIINLGQPARFLAAPVHLYIDAGATSPNYGFTDSAGHVWSNDRSYIGGGTETFEDSIFDAPNGTGFVYQTNRLGGNFQYAFTGLQPGAPYAVSLLFCELYFTDLDARRFTVTYNGQQFLPGLSNFSVIQAAGGKDLAYDASFNLTADAAGTLTLSFMALKDNAILGGLEVRDAFPSAQPWHAPTQAPGLPPTSASVHAPPPAEQQSPIPSVPLLVSPPTPSAAPVQTLAPVPAPASAPVKVASPLLAPAAVPVQGHVPAIAGQMSSGPPALAPAHAPVPVQASNLFPQELLVLPMPVPASQVVLAQAAPSHGPSQAPPPHGLIQAAVAGPFTAQAPAVIPTAVVGAMSQAMSPASALQLGSAQPSSQPPSQASAPLLISPTMAPKQPGQTLSQPALSDLLPAQAVALAAPSPSVQQYSTEPGSSPPVPPSAQQMLSTADISDLAAMSAAHEEADCIHFTRGQVAGLIVGLWLGLLLVIIFLAALLMLSLKGRAGRKQDRIVPILARSG